MSCRHLHTIIVLALAGIASAGCMTDPEFKDPEALEFEPAIDITEGAADDLSMTTARWCESVSGSVTTAAPTRYFTFQGGCATAAIDLVSPVGNDVYVALFVERHARWEFQRSNDDCTSGTRNSCLRVSTEPGVRYLVMATTYSNALLNRAEAASFDLRVSCLNAAGTCVAPDSPPPPSGDFSCEGVDASVTPGELSCWVRSISNTANIAVSARLETRRSSEGEWLEATVQVNDPRNPFQAVARRPLPGRMSPVRHDNVFIQVRSQSAAGDFETAQIFSGEPDHAEVTSPSYRRGFFLENHGGADPEFDAGIQCALRCDGGGTQLILDPPVNVSAVPVADRPGVVNRCRVWGGAFGGSESAPGFVTEGELLLGSSHTREVMQSAFPLHHTPEATQSMMDYDITFAWLKGVVPANYPRFWFGTAAELTRGAMVYSSGRSTSPDSIRNSIPWHLPSSRMQMGPSSDPRSFTIACELEFDEPWNF